MKKNREVISVAGLRKSYDEVVAVDGVSFRVPAGEIFGMVGPNGSGKTTTIECIEGLRRPDEGTVSVLGLDPWQDTRDWQPLLEGLGLGDKRRAYFSQLSGGQKQRLFVALALINQPEVVFLDELTTGLDPRARHDIWDLVREIREQGTTVFLTTHFMDEAEKLCDRVAILDQGRIIALDTPDHLVSQLGMATRIAFQLNGRPRSTPDNGHDDSLDKSFNPALIGAIDGVQRVEQDRGQVVVYGQGDGLVGAVVMSLETAGVPFNNLRTEHANLEDVFLMLTGREIEN
jgi:ABC-2 type transport system ATP-binding protein